MHEVIDSKTGEYEGEMKKHSLHLSAEKVCHLRKSNTNSTRDKRSGSCREFCHVACITAGCQLGGKGIGDNRH